MNRIIVPTTRTYSMRAGDLSPGMLVRFAEGQYEGSYGLITYSESANTRSLVSLTGGSAWPGLKPGCGPKVNVVPIGEQITLEVTG